MDDALPREADDRPISSGLVTEPGVPPTSPEGLPASTVGPPPRVGAGDVNARPGVASAEPAPAPAPAATVAPDDDPPPDEPTDADPADEGQFWSESQQTRRRGRRGVESRLRTMLEWVAVAVGALAVALLIKAFLLQAFYIPSGSMEPTLQQDDRVLVNKLSYRFGDPQRGDVIVFHKPENAPGTIDDFIKRVIGLPGETISFSDGTVFIDGRALDESYVAGAPTNNGTPIRGCVNEPAADRCTIPPDMVFVMGDNRVGSQDSRIFGPIDIDSIVGRAFLKVWPLGDLGFL